MLHRFVPAFFMCSLASCPLLAGIEGRQITLPRWGFTQNGQLGLGDAVVENFEDASLAPGLQVRVITGNGTYGPTSTLPSVFNTSVDAFGSAFLNTQWEGAAGLINTATNQTRFYNDANNWGDIELLFDPPVRLVAFSIAQREAQTIVFVNGSPFGELGAITGVPASSGRGGYAIIEATGQDTISSIRLDNQFGDGFVIDFVAFTPTPKPPVTMVGVSPTQWNASNAELGMPGALLEDFEDVQLIPRLAIGWDAPAGFSAPSNILPTLFNPITDDPHGNAFDNGIWDGSHGAVSGRNNQSWPYANGANWGDMLFTFNPPVFSVGMSLQQMDENARVIVNDRDIGSIASVQGIAISGGRNGFLRLDAPDQAIIESLRIANARTGSFGDGFLVDHLLVRGCGADFNGDGFPDFFDFDDFVSCFEGSACPPGQTADFNGDGFADFFDLDDFISAFESGC